jgi:hypothetical protein
MCVSLSFVSLCPAGLVQPSLQRTWPHPCCRYDLTSVAGIGRESECLFRKRHKSVTPESLLPRLHCIYSCIYSTVFLAQVKCCTQVWGNMWPMFPNLFDQRGARSLLRSWAERVISARNKKSLISGKDRRVLKMNSIFEKETNSYRFFAAC